VARQQLRHALRVRVVHLAAEGVDEHLPGGRGNGPLAGWRARGKERDGKRHGTGSGQGD
jgi:hypothetical protein